METINIMSDSKFKEIYQDEKLRNAVAYAHICCKQDGNEGFYIGQFDYKEALMYPISYSVTDKQIRIAQELISKRKIEVLKENQGNLLFVGMGMEFEPTLKDGVGNHRIRTTFLNSDGVRCFIEVGKGRDDYLRVDFAIYDYKDVSAENKYNYQLLEKSPPHLKYTYENVLKLVNKHFGCNFKKMIVDNYNLSCEGVQCKSLKGGVSNE